MHSCFMAENSLKGKNSPEQVLQTIAVPFSFALKISWQMPECIWGKLLVLPQAFLSAYSSRCSLMIDFLANKAPRLTVRTWQQTRRFQSPSPAVCTYRKVWAAFTEKIFFWSLLHSQCIAGQWSSNLSKASFGDYFPYCLFIHSAATWKLLYAISITRNCM